MSTNYGPESDFNPRPWLDDAPHYRAGDIDIRDVIDAFGLNFNLGSVLKYVTRQKPGNPKLMDLRKARVHLDREIAREEAMVLSRQQVYQAAVSPLGRGEEPGTFIGSSMPADVAMPDASPVPSRVPNDEPRRTLVF